MSGDKPGFQTLLNSKSSTTSLPETVLLNCSFTLYQTSARQNLKTPRSI